MMTIKRRKDVETKKVFMHKLADIRGGVTIKTSELGGDYIVEGTAIGAPVSGLCSVVKVAKIVTEAANDATAYEVAKGHHFKVGDIVCNALSKKAYTITAIDKTTSAAKDTITIGTTLGVVVAVGEYLMQATAESASTASALKVTPQSLIGTGGNLVASDNFFTDAILIGVTQGNELPTAVSGKLTGIISL